MFGKSKEAKPQNRIDSLIGAGMHVEGNIRFTGGLRIDGEVKGNIESAESASSSTLFLSEQARIEGTVKVAHLVVSGTVVGPVRAESSVELQPKARIIGDVEYGLIEMHQGAVIEGRLVSLQKNENPVEPMLAPAD